MSDIAPISNQEVVLPELPNQMLPALEYARKSIRNTPGSTCSQ